MTYLIKNLMNRNIVGLNNTLYHELLLVCQLFISQKNSCLRHGQAFTRIFAISTFTSPNKTAIKRSRETRAKCGHCVKKNNRNKSRVKYCLI